MGSPQPPPPSPSWSLLEDRIVDKSGSDHERGKETKWHLHICVCVYVCTFINTCTRVNMHELSRSNHPKCGKCGPHSKKAIYICVCTCTYTYTYSRFAYGVATISRLLQIIGLFCKRALHKRLYSYTYAYSRVAYGVAMISRLLKNIGFFCRISSLL